VRVVFTVLDALPARHVGPDHTPVLYELAQRGGLARDGALAVMTSATYPNHATFATGAAPQQHGIVSNWIPESGGVVPAWKRGPRVPTLFDACAAARRTSAAVFGDQHLVGVMGATTANSHWPPDGEPPDGARLDAMGYIDDRDTVDQLVDVLDANADLVVAQINGPDTAAHLFGPDADDAFAGYRETDTQLARVREHIAWDDTVWILVSDHDQETVDAGAPVDLQSEIRQRGLDLFALPEGNASLVCGAGALDAQAWLADVDGVAGAEPYALADAALECCLAWTERGRAFGFEGMPTRAGTHGGPRTRAQVAAVTGGHAAVEPLARAVERGPVHAADWAPTIVELLDLELPTATGRSLLG
jgi:arylsulfatase A-like enzyme